MSNFQLVLLCDGDIEIWKWNDGLSPKRIYHKSYNLGDNLEDNLLRAFKFWEEKRNKGGD